MHNTDHTIDHFFYRQKDYNNGLIRHLIIIHFMASPKMKAVVNISLFFGILKMEIYVTNYNVKQRTGMKRLEWSVELLLV